MSEFKVLDLGVELAPKRLIMVVDDEPSMQSLVHDTLADEYRLVTAYNGREGVTRAATVKPDLILMDLMMPDLGGFEAVRQLQNNPETKSIPVLMVTAQDFDDTTIQMIRNERNVVGFISKPFRPKALREAVRVAINKRI